MELLTSRTEWSATHQNWLVTWLQDCWPILQKTPTFLYLWDTLYLECMLDAATILEVASYCRNVFSLEMSSLCLGLEDNLVQKQKKKLERFSQLKDWSFTLFDVGQKSFQYSNLQGFGGVTKKEICVTMQSYYVISSVLKQLPSRKRVKHESSWSNSDSVCLFFIPTVYCLGLHAG